MHRVRDAQKTREQGCTGAETYRSGVAPKQERVEAPKLTIRKKAGGLQRKSSAGIDRITELGMHRTKDAQN